MPITFVPSPPSGLVGPGIPYTITWPDAPSPLPQVFLGLTVYSDEAQQNLAWSETEQPTAFPFTNFLSLTHPQNTSVGLFTLKDGDTCYVHAAVVPIGFPTQSDNHTLTWSDAGLPALLQHLNQVTAGGVGLTSQQAQQLTDIHEDTPQILSVLGVPVPAIFPDITTGIGQVLGGITTTLEGAAGAVSQSLGALFSGKTLDLVTTIQLGAACAPDVIDINVTGATVFALDVQVTSFPDYFFALPYADDYYRQTFGTVEIIRGGNVVHWHGLHTRSYRVEPLPGTVSGPVVLQLPVLPFDYRFRIVPSPGVCLSAQIDRLP